MRIFLQFLTGLIFGLGLLLSGMANPAKVLNFLDIAGSWDPSLAFVMGGAVMVAFFGFRFAQRRSAPFFAAEFQLPTRQDIDFRILTGPAMFGVGWGIGGFCPGPALTATMLAQSGQLVFLPAMLTGMVLAKLAAARISYSPAVSS